MILLLFYEMKLLAFIGELFTPMLSLLLFFLFITPLFSAPLSCFFFLLFILYPLLFCSFILVLSLSCFSPLNPSLHCP
ncbi:hypothetical protein PPACK8108_LOCUS6583 [Phakopsora pachyrhizi]|uniref:Uncharacterized protein n=1 Tax=Phakopsora pachyrhizi TaxID=170000 RepID=A0AAV0AT64_PHAPC|nr:hypothetical protein PPACK8108_LOCUS6583 [Phakopsora pachyrhizi]